MFTGIVQDIGRVTRIQRHPNALELSIESKAISQNSERGDSISVNGVCLTIHALDDSVFHLHVMTETVQKSNLSDLAVGAVVNLERALTPSTLMGGHVVQGHVDDTGTVIAMLFQENHWLLTIQASDQILPYLIPKASIAINGISLTVVEVQAASFSVSIIPTTYQDTIIHTIKSGDRLNLEVDIMAKYVYHYMTAQGAGRASPGKTTLSEGFLKEHGF